MFFWDFSVFDAQVRCLSKRFTKCWKKLDVLLTMFPTNWNLHCFVTLIFTILKNSKYFQCLLWLFDFWCAGAMFEHCAFREGPHRAHLGTPWGLWHHMGLGSPMWCHTACGTTWDAQCGATQLVAQHGSGVPNVVPHGLWHHMLRPIWCHTVCGGMGKWGNGERGKRVNGDMGKWRTGEQGNDMGKRWNGEMGP